MGIFSCCPPGLADTFAGVRIGIAGCGGIGSNAAGMLVRSGAVDLVLADFDRVEPGNLNRQFFFADQIGMSKPKALQANLRRINPGFRSEVHSLRISPENVTVVFGECDILIEAFDDSEAKAMLIEEWSALHSDRPIVACSGVAGTGTHCRITTLRTGSLSVVGDHTSTLSQGTFSARVTAVAAAMVSEVYQRLTGNLCDKGCCETMPKGTRLVCGGREVPLSGFPAKMLEGTVRGLVGSLKDVDPDDSVLIEMGQTRS